MVTLRSSVLLLLAVLAPAVALPAAAQGTFVPLVSQTTVELLLMPPAEPIPPRGEMAYLLVEVRYVYFGGVPTMEPTAVDLRVVGAPAWAQVTVSPSTLIFSTDALSPCGCTVMKAEHAMIIVTLSEDAPAFHAGILDLEAHAHPNGLLAASEARNSVPIVAGFFGMTEAKLERAAVRLGPKDHTFIPMRLDNLGNGPVKLHFASDGAPAGIQVIPPSPIVLEPRMGGGPMTSGTVVWTVIASDRFAEGTVDLLVESAYALDPGVPGDQLTVPLGVARPWGQGGGPGGDEHDLGAQSAEAGLVGSPLLLGLAAAGIVGAVMLRRRRNRPDHPVP